MTRTKIISGLLLATIFLAAQITAAGAAPANQDTPPITGAVVEITLETDSGTGVTTVLVTLVDETGATQTVRLSLADATALELVNEDGTVNSDAIDTLVEIDPDLVIPDVPDEPEEKQHPVGSAIAEFFYDLVGVDYETVMDYHEEGIGFGVIAQALWMTKALEGDSEIFAAILEAKQNHDFSGITLPDGNTPENWGQFRKAVMKDQEKAKQNLGAIMSGHAEDGQGDGSLDNNVLEKGKNKVKDNNGNNKDKDKGKNK